MTERNAQPHPSAYGPSPPSGNAANGTAPPPVRWQPRANPAAAGLTADIALDALAYSQGNPAIAAERLGLESAEQLLGLLSLDETVHPRAQAVLRFMQLGELLGGLQHVQAELLERLERMEDRDVAKLYTTMVMAAELFTKNAAPTPNQAPNTQVNVTQNILRMVPPEVRQAIRVLMPPEPTDGTVLDSSGPAPQAQAS